MLMDSGAAVSILPVRLFETLPLAKRPTVYEPTVNIIAGNDSDIDCMGLADLTITIDGMTFTQAFHITTNAPTPILGLDFLKKQDITSRPSQNYYAYQGKQFTLFDSTGVKLNTKVVAAKTIHLAPGQEVVLSGVVVGKKNIEGIPVVLERARTVYPKTGAIVAKIVVTPKVSHVPVRLYNPCEQHVTIYKRTTLGILHNLTDVTEWNEKEDWHNGPTEDVKVAATSVTEEQVVEEEPGMEMTDEEFSASIATHLQQLYTDSVKQLNTRQQRQVGNLLNEFSDIFATDKNDIGRTHLTKHVIDTGDEQPVKQRPRRIPRAHTGELQNQVKQLADTGVIRPSNSSWASNVLLVRKKDGSFRMCIDYRELNAKTKHLDEYMLPRIDDTIDALHRAQFFCTLDLMQGYHQVELEETSKCKTAFHAPQCNPAHWEFVFMPFGLTGAPRTFQKMMDRLLKGLEFKIALAYLDDIIVFGATIDECIVNLRVVFQRIRDAALKLKAKKCSLFAAETLYLGHIISGSGVKCDPSKVEAVRKWHSPRTQRQVRTFLGTTNYYRKFIKSYAGIARPLYELTKKNKKFHWNSDCEEAFQMLKESLVSAPIMAFPQPQGTFILDTDASGYAIGGVLSQLQKDEDGEEVERVIAYASRTLTETERRYCARRRELLAIVHFAKHFDVYLRGPPIIIRTDHASLRYLKTLADMPDQFARWIMALETYTYTIEVRKGVDHANADGVSRLICDGKSCICAGVSEMEAGDDWEDSNIAYGSMTSVPSKPTAHINMLSLKPMWTETEMAQEQREDDDIRPIYLAKKNGWEKPKWNEISGESLALKALRNEWARLVMKGELLFRRWESDDGTEVLLQLVLPRKFVLLVMERFHDSNVGGHMGRRRTFRLLNRQVYWYKMFSDVKLWIRCCDRCQRRKGPSKKAKAPLTIFNSGYRNERVSMDVCGPMITTVDGNKLVIVFTDSFSKFTVAVPLKDQQARTVVEVFQERWLDIFGQPTEVHHDQGTNFESKLMKEFCDTYKIKQTRTTAFHPQGDGQVERFNKTMAEILSMLGGKGRGYQDWDLKLNKAVACYNATEHSVTGFTPNRLWFGRELFRGDYVVPVEKEKSNTPAKYLQLLQEDDRIACSIARKNIGRAALVNKEYHDRSAYLERYQVGDMVMMTDESEVETGTRKFTDRWSGPLYIIDVLSDVTFRIASSEFGKKKVVGHNRLKRYHSREAVDNSWCFRVTKTKIITKPEDKGVQTTEEADTQGPSGEEVREAMRVLESMRQRLATEPAVVDESPEPAPVTRTASDDHRNAVQPVKRGRGRPRKKIQQPAEETRATDLPPVQPRRSGRRRKNLIPPAQYREIIESEMKRGRPKRRTRTLNTIYTWMSGDKKMMELGLDKWL